MDILAILPGAGVLRMKTAAQIGLYNKDTLTEEFDLTLKLFKSGGNIEFVPDAIAWTYCKYMEGLISAKNALGTWSNR
jgi:cellulose synthase/poly-beta-1,6-N-acetylglucosamine synthase-like glycosyltransferase